MSQKALKDKALKVVFMGTPDFAVSALQALINSQHEVCAVYSRAPRPKGRGHKIQKSPVHELAEAHNIPVYTPKTLKNEEAQEQFASLGADVGVVAAYGLLLPEAVLEAPRFGCLNIHASLLPRWRGASPIHHVIWKGDDKSGVTIMQMDKGMDTGAMISKGEIRLNAGTTTVQLHDDLAVMGAHLVLGVLERMASGDDVQAQAQDDALSTYAPLLKKEDGCVRWTQIAYQIDRQVRALNPWPGVWTTTKEGRRFKVLEAHCLKMPYPAQEALGTVLNIKGEVMCSDGSVLKITKIQPEGKAPMDFTSALNGNYLVVGDIFV
jgi:methionyl-tRNA formyltransferase